MATHSSVLAWRIPGMEEPGGLPSVGSHRVGHDWNDLAAAAICLLHVSPWTMALGVKIRDLEESLSHGSCPRGTSHMEHNHGSNVSLWIGRFPVCTCTIVLGFPGGSVVKNLFANTGDTSSIPDPGKSHLPQNVSARVPQLLSLCSGARGCSPRLMKLQKILCSSEDAVQPKVK